LFNLNLFKSKLNKIPISKKHAKAPGSKVNPEFLYENKPEEV